MRYAHLARDHGRDAPHYAHSTPEARKKAVESIISHTRPDTNCEQTVNREVVRIGKRRKLLKTEWAHQGSNLGPTDYESAALTN